VVLGIDRLIVNGRNLLSLLHVNANRVWIKSHHVLSVDVLFHSVTELIVSAMR
jgi:hypothetical protein